MKPMLVAVTKPRVRADADADTKVFWKEFRVRKLSAADWDEARRTGRAGPFAVVPPRGGFLIEHRRVDADGGVESPRDWAGWWTADTLAGVIDEMLGDSDFLKADSRHPTHAVLVRYHHERVAADAVEYEAGKAMRAAHAAVEEYKRDENAKYAKKIAGKDEAAAKKAADRMLKTVGPRLAELRAAASAADAAFRAAESAARRIKAHTPKLADYPDLAARFAPAAAA